jgi:pimeloyl-ACP methyl ester carboxylesterase
VEQDSKEVFPQVWFIHGANATPESFNYLKSRLAQIPELNNYVFKDIVYDCQDSLTGVVRVLLTKVPRNVPLFLVGHSLGGVLAASFAKAVEENNTHIDLRGIITMASPLGGSESANYLKWVYPSYKLFQSIATNGPIIKLIKSYVPKLPFLSLVTSSGNNPLFPTANDGVVTVLAQRSLTGPTYVELPSNHFEVLVNPVTVTLINEFLIKTMDSS